MTTPKTLLAAAEELDLTYPYSPIVRMVVPMLKEAAALAEQAQLLRPLIDQLKTTLEEMQHATA